MPKFPSNVYRGINNFLCINGAEAKETPMLNELASTTWTRVWSHHDGMRIAKETVTPFGQTHQRL